jgi:hypothetical protein
MRTIKETFLRRESNLTYPHLPTVRQTGSECFTIADQRLPIDLLSFWQWSASDLIGNTSRGCLAEYIVAMALGLTDGVRNDWEAYDLQFNQWNMEVKASAYLQSWFQKRLCRPSFSIRPARRWDPRTGEMSREVKRHAHLYVFCLHDHKEKSTLNPLNLDQWTFYVVPTIRIEKNYPKAERIDLGGVLSLSPYVAKYSDLRYRVLDGTRELDLSATDQSW